MSLPRGLKSDRWLLAERAGTDFFSSDYCCSLARGNAPSLELLRLSHIIPECHSALKGAVKKMTQEFVKKLMFPLIPGSPLGLAGTPAKEAVNERGGIKSHCSCPRANTTVPGLCPLRGGEEKGETSSGQFFWLYR